MLLPKHEVKPHSKSASFMELEKIMRASMRHHYDGPMVSYKDLLMGVRKQKWTEIDISSKLCNPIYLNMEKTSKSCVAKTAPWADMSQTRKLKQQQQENQKWLWHR